MFVFSICKIISVAILPFDVHIHYFQVGMLPPVEQFSDEYKVCSLLLPVVCVYSAAADVLLVDSVD